MDLFIAEKPSVAQAIAEALPGAAARRAGYIEVGNTVVAWCFGHLLAQVEPEGYNPALASWSLDSLPIIPDPWKLTPRPKAADQLAVIKQLLAKASRVINAGDADQEGQLLVDEVLEHFRYTGRVDRVLVTSVEPDDVQLALRRIESNTLPRYVGWREWARCRSRLDWLIGMNLSRAYTLRARASTGFRGVLSVGRVQTPTLALVVRRDEAIERFKPIPFYGLKAALQHQGVTFSATWRASAAQSGRDEAGRLVDPAAAQALLARTNGMPATVAKFASDAKKQAAPSPFDLTALQVACNNAFGYTAAKTLEVAQALYETHKVTTYPRTDKTALLTEHHQTAKERFAAVASTLPDIASAIAHADWSLKSKVFNDAEATPHHGIIPTKIALPPNALNEAERNVYGLIARAFLAQFCQPYQYLQTSCELSIGGETFAVSGRVSTHEGWRAVFAVEDEKQTDDSEDSSQAIPTLTTGAQLPGAVVTLQSKKTTAPARFTEASLLKAMANIHLYIEHPVAKARLKDGDGIGTSATRAGILEELKRRQFLVATGKQLISSSTGRALVNALPPIITDAGFTGLTEQTLDQVAAGQITPAGFMAKTAQLVTTLVNQAATGTVNIPVEKGPACPTCKQGELRRIRKKPSGFFWGCSRFSEGCKATFEDRRGKPALVAKATKRATGKKTATKKRAATKSAPKKGGK